MTMSLTMRFTGTCNLCCSAKTSGMYVCNVSCQLSWIPSKILIPASTFWSSLKVSTGDMSPNSNDFGVVEHFYHGNNVLVQAMTAVYAFPCIICLFSIPGSGYVSLCVDLNFQILATSRRSSWFCDLSHSIFWIYQIISYLVLPLLLLDTKTYSRIKAWGNSLIFHCLFSSSENGHRQSLVRRAVRIFS